RLAPRHLTGGMVSGLRHSVSGSRAIRLAISTETTAANAYFSAARSSWSPGATTSRAKPAPAAERDDTDEYEPVADGNRDAATQRRPRRARSALLRQGAARHGRPGRRGRGRSGGGWTDWLPSSPR